jgi:hypothetical protein
MHLKTGKKNVQFVTIGKPDNPVFIWSLYLLKKSLVEVLYSCLVS